MNISIVQKAMLCKNAALQKKAGVLSWLADLLYKGGDDVTEAYVKSKAPLKTSVTDVRPIAKGFKPTLPWHNARINSYLADDKAPYRIASSRINLDVPNSEGLSSTIYTFDWPHVEKPKGLDYKALVEQMEKDMPKPFGYEWKSPVGLDDTMKRKFEYNELKPPKFSSSLVTNDAAHIYKAFGIPLTPVYNKKRYAELLRAPATGGPDIKKDFSILNKSLEKLKKYPDPPKLPIEK